MLYEIHRLYRHQAMSEDSVIISRYNYRGKRDELFSCLGHLAPNVGDDPCVFCGWNFSLRFDPCPRGMKISVAPDPDVC